MPSPTRADAGVYAFSDDKLPFLLDRAKALQPLMRNMAPEAERLRTLTPEVEQGLRAMAGFSLMLPERVGGVGLSLSAYGRILMEIARGDPSVAWVVQILNGTSWGGTLAADPIQDVLFADGPTTICGASNPPASTRKVDGGYVVNGAWPYISGSRQGAWVQCSVLLDGGPNGPKTPAAAYVPMRELELTDSWFVTGMQGTGSDTVIARDLFVPDRMISLMDFAIDAPEQRRRHLGAPSDWWALLPTIRATGIVLLLGAAREMQALCEADSKKKPIVMTPFKVRTESAVVVHELGRVAAQLDNAEVLLFSALAELDALALRRVKPPFEVCSRQRALCAQAIPLIHGAIEQIMFISGSSAFALSNPLQRYWRDIHMGMRHIQYSPMIGHELYGRDNLGALPNLLPPGLY